MSALDSYIKGLVDAAPPLSEAQKDRLYLLLHGDRARRPVYEPTTPAPTPPQKPTKVYRHYDACGCLLYIGISHDPVQRAFAHEKGSWWKRWAVRMDTDEVVYADRCEAESAERELIREESPVFNRTHALDQKGAIVRYLIAHERWEHLTVPLYLPAEKRVELIRSLAETNLLSDIGWDREPLA